MIRNRKLKKMSGNAFMTEDWTRIFDRRANIKVFRLRIVGRNEKEAGGIFVINTGRIHETPRAGWLESVGQLSNLKRTEIIRQRNEVVFFQEIDHFLLATLIRF